VILLASILIGAMAVCVRVAARELPAGRIAFFRFLGSFLILLPIAYRHKLRPQRASAPAILLRAVFGTSAILLYYRGIGGAGAGLATMLHCTYPIHTAVFAGLVMGEVYTVRVGLALVCSVAGAAIVLGPTAHLTTAELAGGLYALGAAVLAGASITTIRHLRRTESAVLVTTYFMGLGTLFTAPALIGHWPSLSGTVLLALAGTILASLAAQLLLHQGLGFAGATQGSLAAATSVVSAAAFEAIFLGKGIAPSMLLGGTLLVLAMGIAASSAPEAAMPD